MKNIEFDWSRVPEQFVVFDLETTGLDPDTCEIIEIGALKFDKEKYLSTKSVDTFQCFIKQSQPLPPIIVRITSITDAMVSTGEDLHNGLAGFLSFVDGRTLVSYNAKFDMKFLRTAAKKSPLQNSLQASTQR